MARGTRRSEDRGRRLSRCRRVPPPLLAWRLLRTLPLLLGSRLESSGAGFHARTQRQPAREPKAAARTKMILRGRQNEPAAREFGLLLRAPHRPASDNQG